MMGRTLRWGAIVSLLFLTVAAYGFGITGASDATPLASPVASPVVSDGWPSWVEIGPGDATIVRAVRAETCPAIRIDGTVASMNIRAQPTADHPNVVCEATLPAGSDSVSIEGEALPLPAPEPQRIAVIGDAGCRLSAPDWFQACDDPAAWPFERVAGAAAHWNPDLVIHVGDYVYRESPCPEGNAGCADSPFGDNWDAWNADFFAPAGTLLDAAPWVFVRGNHEDCARAGEGWFRYLDPMPMPQECETYTEPWAFHIGDVRTVVLDVASAEDISASKDVTDAYEPIFDKAVLLAAGAPETWLLIHRPFWSIGAGNGGIPTEWSTATYNDSGFADQTKVFDLVIAGHVHMSQLLWFTPESKRAPQLIAGASGTELEDMATDTFAGTDLADPELVQGQRWREFSFVTVQPLDTGFVTSVRLSSGTVAATCLSVGGQFSCIPG